MRYLLDTNACVDKLNRRYPNVVWRIQSAVPDDLCVSSVVAAELGYGADRSSKPRRNHSRLHALLSENRCLSFDEEAARVFGRACSRLEAKGRPIGALRHAVAHALSRALTLITVNVDEFSRVDGLKVENWR